jgi:hypothetical protein
MRDFESAKQQNCNQHGRNYKHHTGKRPLTPARAANNFCAATATDSRVFRNGRLAVRACENLHVRIIIARMFRTN